MSSARPRAFAILTIALCSLAIASPASAQDSAVYLAPNSDGACRTLVAIACHTSEGFAVGSACAAAVDTAQPVFNGYDSEDMTTTELADGSQGFALQDDTVERYLWPAENAARSSTEQNVRMMFDEAALALLASLDVEADIESLYLFDIDIDGDDDIFYTRPQDGIYRHDGDSATRIADAANAEPGLSCHTVDLNADGAAELLCVTEAFDPEPARTYVFITPEAVLAPLTVPRQSCDY